MNEVNKVKVVLYLDEAIAKRIEAARCSVNLRSKQQWIYMAISSYLGRWKQPLENDKLWPPCRICGRKHDTLMAHGIE